MATLTGDKTKAQILADSAIDRIQLNKDLTWKDKKAIKTAEEYTPTTAADWDGTITDQDGALDELASRVKDSEDEASSTATAIGITLGDEDVGTFTGDIISDNGTAVEALQELEDAIEANSSAGGITAGDTDVGTFTGDIISDNGTVAAGMQELETAVENIQKVASGTISSAEILALNATPKELIAAPGAGKLIVIDEVELFLDYGAAQYAADAGEDFTIQYATSDTAIVSVDNDSEGFLLAAASANRLVKPSLYSGDGSAALFDPDDGDNEAIEAQILVGEWATGDSDIKYSIKYHVVTLLS